MSKLFRISRHGKTLTHVEANSEVMAAVSYVMKTGDTDPVKVTSVLRVPVYKRGRYIPRKKQ